MDEDFVHLVMPSPLGALTLFATGDGLTVIETGAAPTTGKGNAVLREAKRQLDAYFDGKRTSFDLPLAPGGTPRQKEIWAAMCKIPYGETRTYGDIAKQIGSAARAVGTACARNTLPIVVPCHRVLGADRKLGFYSFADGPETKQRLLNLEGFSL